MSAQNLSLTNQQARQLWLDRHGLLGTASRIHSHEAFNQTLIDLGMIQLDSIGVLARAHHHIMWSRHSAYREQDYTTFLEGRRDGFEHFSHDAALLPIGLYPYWRRQQKRRSLWYLQGALCKQISNTRERRRLIRQLLDHIETQGPMCSRDFATVHTARADRSQHAWARPPHKHALDYLWLSGELEVSHRKGFTKYYDLSDRIIPQEISRQVIPDSQQIDHLCRSALERLGFARDSEIRRFHEACTLQEVQHWLRRQKRSAEAITIELHDHKVVHRYADPRIESWLKQLPTPASRVRIINPFDPAVRDRDRLKKLFGFDFRIEIYTPANKRRFGYYVCPLLEGDRFIGRIDVKANRQSDRLETRAWWLEAGIKAGKQRKESLMNELKRLAMLSGVSGVATLPEHRPTST